MKSPTNIPAPSIFNHSIANKWIRFKDLPIFRPIILMLLSKHTQWMHYFFPCVPNRSYHCVKYLFIKQLNINITQSMTLSLLWLHITLSDSTTHIGLVRLIKRRINSQSKEITSLHCSTLHSCIKAFLRFIQYLYWLRVLLVILILWNYEVIAKWIWMVEWIDE